MVPFSGPKTAKIYIVGDGPTSTDMANKKIFTGGTGQILDRLLRDSGLTRDECRLANVVRVQPKGNNYRNLYHDKSFKSPTAELEADREYLIADIKECKPNVVVCLGDEPLSALIGHRGIDVWRGSILWSKKADCKVVASLHPGYIMRMWKMLPLALFDFKRISEECLTPVYVPLVRDMILAPTFEQCMVEIERLKGVEHYAFDVETVYKEEGDDIIPRLTCISFADTTNHAICIPFTYSRGLETIDYWENIDEEIAILHAIRDLLETKSIKKFAQNLPYDVCVLASNPPYARVNNFELDTMCAFHLLYSELPKNLGVITSVYTKQIYYKDTRTSGNDMEFWEYNCLDSMVTLESGLGLIEDLKEFDLLDFYYKYVHSLLPVVIDMQLRGVAIDIPMWEAANKEYGQRVLDCIAKGNELIEEGINLASPKQLCSLLYDKLGFPEQYNKKGKVKSRTTDEKAVTKLKATIDHPILDLIIDFRHVSKVHKTYLTDLFWKDKRTRSSYLIGGDKDGQGGTETGRLSSRESIFGIGTNNQNIPKGICRRMFIADKDRLFFATDLSQAEVWIVAYMAEEERLISVLNSGGDIHTQNAAWIFGKRMEDVTKWERTIAKRLVHASNYGIGARAFGWHAGVRESEARDLLDKYFTTFPNIKMWQLQIQSHLSKSRILTSPLGRKRMFFARQGDTLFRSAYAFVPQSTVADSLNLAMATFYNKYQQYPVMMQIHDEFIIQAPADYNIQELLDCFKVPIRVKNREFTIPVTVKKGKNWNDLEEVNLDEYR